VRETTLWSVRAFRLSSAHHDVQVDRALMGRARGRGEIDRRIRSRAHQRVSDALESDEHGAPAGADTLVIDVDKVAEARLTRRFRLCKRTLTLLDGRRLRWRWLSSAVSGRYEDAAPALERCLGERLHGR